MVMTDNDVQASQIATRATLIAPNCQGSSDNSHSSCLRQPCLGIIAATNGAGQLSCCRSLRRGCDDNALQQRRKQGVHTNHPAHHLHRQPCADTQRARQGKQQQKCMNKIMW
jgi:hypothetical protein